MMARNANSSNSTDVLDSTSQEALATVGQTSEVACSVEWLLTFQVDILTH